MNALLLIATLITVDSAVDIARHEHPDLAAADARASGAEARADAAEAERSPTLSARSRIGTTVSGPFGTAVNSVTTYDLGLSAGLLLWDSGRTRDRIDAADQRSEAQRRSAAVTRADTVTNVRLAFFEAQLRKSLKRIADENLASIETHRRQIEALVAAGARPEIDRLRERTAVAAARASAVRATGDYRASRTALNRAMGRTGPADFDISDRPMPMVHGEDLDTASLASTALQSRPELAVIDAEIAAQKLTIRSTSKGLHPSIRIGADAGWGGAGLSTPGWNAGVGITLSWNLFDGGATRANTRATEMELVVMRSRRKSLEQQIYAEVEAARIAVRTAKHARLAADETVAAATELLGIAEQRYQSGVGNVIELNDARTALTRAAGDRARAIYELSAARSRLLRALGTADESE